MDSSLIPTKTPKAWEVLQGRDFPGTRAQRALLIMADGRKTLGDLAGVMGSLGLSSADLRVLGEAGWITWAGQPAAVAGPAEVVLQAPAAAPGPARTLAAAKFFALDLVGRMLGQRDEPLRAAARDVADAEDLLTWLAVCVDTLRREAGDEPAEMFHLRVRALLPEDVAVRL